MRVADLGTAPRREKRMAAAYPDTDVLVFGHSHIPWDTFAENGLEIDRRRNS
jgi:predicted phosphodiesterase